MTFEMLNFHLNSRHFGRSLTKEQYLIKGLVSKAKVALSEICNFIEALAIQLEVSWFLRAQQPFVELCSYSLQANSINGAKYHVLGSVPVNLFQKMTIQQILLTGLSYAYLQQLILLNKMKFKASVLTKALIEALP